MVSTGCGQQSVFVCRFLEKPITVACDTQPRWFQGHPCIAVSQGKFAAGEPQSSNPTLSPAVQSQVLSRPETIRSSPTLQEGWGNGMQDPLVPPSPEATVPSPAHETPALPSPSIPAGDSAQPGEHRGVLKDATYYKPPGCTPQFVLLASLPERTQAETLCSCKARRHPQMQR